jgi:hypothetical protein
LNIDDILKRVLNQELLLRSRLKSCFEDERKHKEQITQLIKEVKGEYQKEAKSYSVVAKFLPILWGRGLHGEINIDCRR